MEELLSIAGWKEKSSVVKTFPCEQIKLGFILGILRTILVTMFLYEDLDFAKRGFIFVYHLFTGSSDS